MCLIKWSQTNSTDKQSTGRRGSVSCSVGVRCSTLLTLASLCVVGYTISTKYCIFTIQILLLNYWIQNAPKRLPLFKMNYETTVAHAVHPPGAAPCSSAFFLPSNNLINNIQKIFLGICGSVPNHKKYESWFCESIISLITNGCQKAEILQLMGLSIERKNDEKNLH